MNDEINVKMIDFSTLSKDDEFFLSRENALTKDFKWAKTDTTKDRNGHWKNAINYIGSQNFVKYDARVWVRK